MTTLKLECRGCDRMVREVRHTDSRNYTYTCPECSTSISSQHSFAEIVDWPGDNALMMKRKKRERIFGQDSQSHLEMTSAPSQVSHPDFPFRLSKES